MLIGGLVASGLATASAFLPWVNASGEWPIAWGNDGKFMKWIFGFLTEFDAILVLVLAGVATLLMALALSTASGDPRGLVITAMILMAGAGFVYVFDLIKFMTTEMWGEALDPGFALIAGSVSAVTAVVLLAVAVRTVGPRPAPQMYLPPQPPSFPT